MKLHHLVHPLMKLFWGLADPSVLVTSVEHETKLLF